MGPTGWTARVRCLSVVAALGVAGCGERDATEPERATSFALSVDEGPETRVEVGELGPEGRSLVELLPPPVQAVGEWKGIMVEVRGGAHRLLVEPERSFPGARYAVVPCERGLGVVVRPAAGAPDAPEHVRRALERPVFEACGVDRVVLATRNAPARPAEAEPTLAIVVDGHEHAVPVSRVQAAERRGGEGGRGRGAMAGAPLAALLPGGLDPATVTSIVAHTGDGARVELPVDAAFSEPPRLGVQLNRRGLVKIEVAGEAPGADGRGEQRRRPPAQTARDVVRLELTTRSAAAEVLP